MSTVRPNDLDPAIHREEQERTPRIFVKGRSQCVFSKLQITSRLWLDISEGVILYDGRKKERPSAPTIDNCLLSVICQSSERRVSPFVGRIPWFLSFWNALPLFHLILLDHTDLFLSSARNHMRVMRALLVLRAAFHSTVSMSATFTSAS
ncbi:uncharacterized protein BDZ99DRAFT_514067 [Mytilinidion resinicola]|uniref:Uncharacterized protein n=1 Tax=Mytilinidion resinicola TaxID=574789 RepID=A0A6A6ZC13_9PEZI|nr:uncharacterized protein BDZ99DRAFT_514067 [Mytilinidion resinicola]KAF2817854.1 hypothetical protein BDZ99DRAFT_514067 [Mytilinidion resinicola]